MLLHSSSCIGRQSSCYTVRLPGIQLERLSPRTRPAGGLQRSRGPLGKCSSCDDLSARANLKVKVGGDEIETESHGCQWGGTGEEGPAEAACAAAGGDARRRRRAKRYGNLKGLMPCGSVKTQLSIAAAEKGQAVWPGTRVRRSATRSAGGRSCGGEPSGATRVQRGQGGAKLETEAELAESRGNRYWRSRA
jgi:hypothetical protein